MKTVMYTIILFISLLLLCIGGCKQKPPIKIGFVGNLTGHLSNWGIESQNGVLLVIEQVNASGGIRKHPIELIIKDGQQDPELAAQAVGELIDEGVVAILGPTISTTAMQVIRIANARQMLLIAPTVITNTLIGRDDFFVSVAQSNVRHASDLAVFLFEKAGWRSIVAAFETSNRAYSENLYMTFQERFESLGGSIEFVQPFSPGSGYAEIARSLALFFPDGIFLVANDIDTAAICKEVRKLNSAVPLAESGLAISDDLIRNGGTAVEGLLLFQNPFDDPVNREYQKFKTLYRDRFGNEPSDLAVYGYDAANVLIEALQQSKEWSPVTLKETILRIKEFHSPLADFEIDAYGDASRQNSIVTVKEGHFVNIQGEDNTTN